MKLRKRQLCALIIFCIIALICACSAPMQELESDVGYGWETVWSDIPAPGQDTAVTAAAQQAAASEAAKIAAIYNAGAADTAKASPAQTVSADTAKPSSPKTVPADTAKVSSAKTVPADTTKPSSAKTVPHDTTKASTAKAVPADTAKASSAKAIPADTTKTSSAKAVPADTAKVSSAKTVPADTTKASSAKTVSADTAKPSSPKTVPADTAKPSTAKAVPADTAKATPPKPTLRPIPVVSDSAKAAFEARFVKATRDTLLAIIRSDYALCVGDASKVSNDQLMSWRVRIDAQVMKDAAYPQMFRDYVKATGIKAQDVRPCEPIAYAERQERERRILDSAFAARRVARDKELHDSISAFKELASLRPGPADILGLPEGLSMSSIQTILAYRNIKTRPMQKHLQADKVDFNGLTVNVAFYFSDNGKYVGYEVETEALRGDRLDNTVRGWAAQLTQAYEKMLGPPNITNRVGFKEIRQGRLSITAIWEKTPKGPRTLIGLATHDNLYYAKVMVAY